MTFLAYALNRAYDVKKFIDNVVMSNRDLLKRVKFEISLFIGTVQSIVSLSNPEASELRFKLLKMLARFKIEKFIGSSKFSLSTKGRKY